MEGVYAFLILGALLISCATIPPEKERPNGETMTVRLPGGAAMEFVWIAPGTFLMGSPTSDEMADDEEWPQHEVTITQGFWLGKYEVTQEQWEAVMGTTPWVERDNVQANPNHPAVYISWNDTQAFIEKLNAAMGEELYRLPTEAEWEYACRAGTTTRWSFGDDESQLKEYAWYWDNACDVGECYAHAVGLKKPNPWGLYDMHGNVWEWCQDRYESYTSRAQTDPAGPVSGFDRTHRGGYFDATARVTRSALRGSIAPDFIHGGVGVRLLRSQ